MKVKDVAKLSSVSVRTLHHYDEIGLLSPEKSSSGYRVYTEGDLAKLQQILFFRSLAFPLKKIKEIMTSPSFDRLEALEFQQKLLADKRKQLDKMLQTIENTIQSEKGELTMSNKEKFTGFDFNHHVYEQEARERWGDRRVDEGNHKVNQNPKQLQNKMNEIYAQLAEVRHTDPASFEAQTAIEKWYVFLNEEIGNYSKEAFQGLGELYVQDERFTKNIDQFGEGLAQFMNEEMGEYGNTN